MFAQINKVLRILIILGLICLAFLSYHYKFGNCDVCRFEYNDKTMDAKDFAKLYSDICINHTKNTPRVWQQQINLSMFENITLH